MTGTFRIVVGVDGSEGGQRALRWAIREAASRGGSVHAATAYDFDDLDASTMRHPEQDKKVAQMLATQVAAALDDGVTATVTTQVTFGAAPEVLADAASGADLLVLGSHGHGRLFHAVLGSVADACIRAATCPVVVVPAPQTEKVTSAPSGVPSGIL